ncbi:MAG: glutamine-hydrolyzing GMP synthase [Piscirickettsiaceae bacterium CG_4_9_14_3_um_filter_43_564]|nr:glutamine-hydrolyzing GMP synthase [Thiomicrospira sp.]OIP93775.1 MAG: glutamine-hydrolyzing GMP synthase [Thiomicrospira sp. CG2_30_44_34]PIQ06442.1 MAG: glutamine-hydrolyzing GMP synthase [Piscirickettsiaceae bacterium CG18_big_fil_WC_8_21_14_2_50_44_103]PIU37867.1 MAG: glutamine-hydrolyzing GMP synthase [Piscirickettsiaceae bacterium CG07_land_8_20_14_0_80_44_28]PIW57237.1 MAG: glutamine-hydrolyzing GMP synthase [Piscirickettsiaceae bacterium CG12_big_fil_rev_8_21_14_0_65_44_934]PIW77961
MSHPNIHEHRILILDFGSQYTQLIARRIREIGVYCEVEPWDADVNELIAFGARGVILSGGPETATGEGAPVAPAALFDLGVPILGICYGMQTMAAQLGGKVVNASEHEYGYAQVRAHGHTQFLNEIEDHVTPEGFGMLDVWMSHGDRVEQLPTGFKLMASTPNCPIAGMANEEKQFYGIQFHPEVTHTTQGQRMIERFVVDICGCEKLWTTQNIIEDSVARIQQQVGTDDVLLGLSGGVDSSVVAALLHKAIGAQLTCVFVDHGLLRHQEGEQVMAMFAENMGIKVIRVDAEQTFMDALKGEADPEIKRKIIGHAFIEVFDEEASKLTNVKWLAQGTIYPDVIESAGAKTGKAKVIKSHHNVGGLPEEMKLSLLEPLRELFKDEVRKLGVALGLPSEMVYRHPFPGPGLGVRILGEVKKEYADILRLADHIFIEELRAADLYDKTSQAFSVFLPVKSVGVVGDARRYDYVVALRAVETIDFMTARWAHLPYDFLEKVSNRIINEIPRITRVTYDISSKPPATIEWE